MADYENERLVQRAIAAYYRAAAREDLRAGRPSEASSLRELNGKRYVVLRDINHVIAVYRVRTDGILKGLKRWPKELEEQV